MIGISSVFIIFALRLSFNGVKSFEYAGDCADLLDTFANSAADFMLCSISKARPIRMCSSCVGSYFTFLDDHRKILEMSVSNISCKDRLINSDRLEIIEAAFIYVSNLWDKGKCPNCFSNGSSNLSNETKEFQKLYDETEACLKNNLNIDNNTYDGVVCKNCSSNYHRLSLYYGSLVREFGDGNVCMDIVDAMNITENLWSGTLRCGAKIMTAETALMASCSAILCLPIIFYLVAWKMSLTSPALVSKQKRLSSRFVERWRSRTGSMISQLRHTGTN